MITDTWGKEAITSDSDDMDIDDNEDEETTVISKEKLAKTIQKARSLVNVLQRSQILMMSINNEKKINNVKCQLISDCITRWNSAYLSLKNLLDHEPILLALFENKRKLLITSKQKEKLGLLELTKDDYLILKDVLKAFEPFYDATDYLSGVQYPTIGLCLFTIRNLKDFLEKKKMVIQIF